MFERLPPGMTRMPSGFEGLANLPAAAAARAQRRRSTVVHETSAATARRPSRALESELSGSSNDFDDAPEPLSALLEPPLRSSMPGAPPPP